MTTLLGALWVHDQSIGLSTDLNRLVRLGNLFCASKEWKGNVDAESGLATTVTADVKCSGTLQGTGSDTLGGMIEEEAQTNSIVLVDDNPGDGLEKRTDVHIQQDLTMDDDTPVGATTCGMSWCWAHSN